MCVRIIRKLRSHLQSSASPLTYRVAEIPKKNGTRRVLHIPNPELKSAQRRLAVLLRQLVYIHNAAHGFRKARSIVSNADNHRSAKAILNVDIVDFFGSIRKGKLQTELSRLRLTSTDEHTLTDAEIGQILTICTLDNRLPQGSPASPLLSNLFCSKLDAALQRYAERHSTVYTRYADGLSFGRDSFNRRFPS